MIFQKPLGWLQRFLYNVEGGSIPFPQPTIDISQDYPLEYTSIVVNATGVIGTVTSTIFAPDQEHHGYIPWLSMSVVGGGTCLVADQFRVRVVDPSTNAMDLTVMSGVATSQYPLIRGGLSTAGNMFLGQDAIYIPPGWTCQIGFTSAAAGLNVTYRGILHQRLKSYPVRPT
jgi:hypothetical protein